MKKRFLLITSLLLAIWSLSTLQAAAPATDFQKITAVDSSKHSHQYGGFYTTETCTVAPEHAISFDKEMVCPTKGIEHSAASGDFIIKEAGVYRVTYSISLECEYPGKSMWKKEFWKNVALTLNDSLIASSKMHVGEDEHLSTLTVLVKICDKSCCGHVLRLINNNDVSKGWHNIKLKAGDCYDNVTASIVIERVGDCDCDCCCKSSK